MTFGSLLSALALGLLTSVNIFVFTLVFSLPLGMLIAFGRMSKILPVRLFFQLYISVMRGTPLMLQLIVCFFGPYYLFGWSLPVWYRMMSVILAFSLNYAAYFAEIYRAGIQSIPIGQYEAANVLGFTPAQTFRKIILPQVIKRVIPPVTNEVITLVKDTSLAFSLSIMEMFTIAKQIASTHTTLLPLVVAGIFYYVFNLVVASGMQMIEKKLDYYR